MVRHGLSHHDIVSVEIKTFHNATRLAGHTPVSADEFAYSIAFPVACMIVRGQVGMPELDISALSDPAILRISTATSLIDDPYLTQISDGKRWAQVSILMQMAQDIKPPHALRAGIPTCHLATRKYQTNITSSQTQS